MPAPAPPDFTFASDNTVGLAPEALAALVAANPGSAAAYGDDAWTQRARGLVRDLFETDCAVFFVFNGTAANALALAALCRRHHSILCHEVAHIDTDECGAPEFFTGGSKIIPLAGPQGKLRPADLAPVLAGGRGVHSHQPGVLSLTQGTEWGTLYTPDEVGALCAVAKKHRLAVHMDGARFATAAAALAPRGVTPADLTWRAGVDVLCLGGTKNGLGSSVAVVFFNPEPAREFEYRVKQAGQLDSKLRFAAAQWVGMLETGAWQRHAAHANAMAARLAAALRPLPGIRFLAEPQANGVFLELPPAAVAKLEASGWHFYRFIGDHGYRLMCSWATAPEAVDRFAADAKAALA